MGLTTMTDINPRIEKQTLTIEETNARLAKAESLLRDWVDFQTKYGAGKRSIYQLINESRDFIYPVAEIKW